MPAPRRLTLGVALVFELPLVIFFLTLLRMASPRWLLKHSRYAILVIVIVAFAPNHSNDNNAGEYGSLYDSGTFMAAISSMALANTCNP